MIAVVLALLTVAQEPGLLPRKPPSSRSHANEGPVITPGRIPDEPVAPPVIIDDGKPGTAAPLAPGQPGPAAPQPSGRAPANAAQDRSPPARAAVTGEWILTRQRGWLWMPHGGAYYHVPVTGRGRPYAYAYAPEQGWSWVEAPWIWGVGPWPRFGANGATRFAWYQAGYWRTPWRWEFWPGRADAAPVR